MGIIHKGIPHAWALRIAGEHSLVNFVETGTLAGKTAKWAAGNFKQVYTVEISSRWFNIASKNLQPYGNVSLIQGDSRQAIRLILPNLKGGTLWWLDAHWSPDLKYNRPDMGECPLLKELKTIAEASGRHVIMIDDARYFKVAGPPAPHKAEQWPTVSEIRNALPGWKITERDDVFLCLKSK